MGYRSIPFGTPDADKRRSAKAWFDRARGHAYPTKLAPAFSPRGSKDGGNPDLLWKLRPKPEAFTHRSPVPPVVLGDRSRRAERMICLDQHGHTAVSAADVSRLTTTIRPLPRPGASSGRLPPLVHRWCSSRSRVLSKRRLDRVFAADTPRRVRQSMPLRSEPIGVEALTRAEF